MQSADLRPVNSQLMDDLARFARYQVATADIDPVYPVLRALYGANPNWSSEMRLWHTLLYVAYYNLPSGYRAFAYVASPENVHMLPVEVLKLPTGVERRGLRGGFHMQEHLYSLAEHWRAYGHSWESFLQSGFATDRCENWSTLQRTLQRVKHNGRWAAYKTGELLQKVHNFPVEPTDMGMAFSSGPRWGLAQFFGPVQGNDREAIDYLDTQAEVLNRYLMSEYGLDLGIEELETILCDFHSLMRGRYYVGKDIDEMQAQILVHEGASSRRLHALWTARAAALSPLYLGERTGRRGIDRDRLTLYRTTGQIVTRR